MFNRKVTFLLVKIYVIFVFLQNLEIHPRQRVIIIQKQTQKTNTNQYKQQTL